MLRRFARPTRNDPVITSELVILRDLETRDESKPQPQRDQAHQLSQSFTTQHVMSAHGSFLAADSESSQLVHEARPTHGRTVTLFRSIAMPHIGFLVANTDLDLYNGAFVSPMLPLILVDHPGTGTLALRSPNHDVHICALSVEHLDRTGETDFYRSWIGPWELFSPHAVPLAMPAPMITEALLEIAPLLEAHLEPQAIIAWLDTRSGLAGEALTTQVVVNLMMRKPIVAPAQAWIPHPQRDLEQEALRPPCAHGPIAGPLQRIAEIRPQPGNAADPALRCGWQRTPKQGASEARLFAIGDRCLLRFAVPHGITHARLRLDITGTHHPLLMTVSVDGWCLGRTAIDHRKMQGGRLDYWIPREAIRAATITIALDFAPAPLATHPEPHAFELLCCVLDAGLGAAPANQPEPKPTPDNAATVMAAFESLGEDCEFGFVQRHFDVEPMSIFRFAGASGQYSLVRMLESDLDGLGSPGSLEAIEHIAQIYQGENQPDLIVPEFFMHDLRWDLRFHTWKGPAESTIEQAIRDNEQKLSYLRRKFLEDLEDGEKIWLYKDTRRVDQNEACAVYDILNRRGANRLFWVTRVVEGRPAGSVEWVGPGMLRGYSDQPHIDAQRFNPASWLALCQNALRAFAEPA